jgi:NADPH-dependent 2,4-dienoyl-CoA reductase/sulfur reductase-like enzyme
VPLKLNAMTPKGGSAIELGQLTVPVGPNNAGKSQTLRDIWDGSITAERLMQFPLEEKSTPPPSRVPGMAPANNWIGWVAQAAAELTGMPEVRVLTHTTAVGCYDHNVVALVERARPASAMAPRERLHIVRAARVVLATGTIEQPLIFDHNDRPGIMLAGGARQYLCRYGVAVGSRVLLATNNDSVYPLAHEFKRAGVEVAVLLDSRREQDIAERLRVPMRFSGIPWFVRSLPIDTGGFNAVRAVTVGRLSIDARHIEARYTLMCDALAMSGGLAPALSLRPGRRQTHL